MERYKDNIKRLKENENASLRDVVKIFPFLSDIVEKYNSGFITIKEVNNSYYEYGTLIHVIKERCLQRIKTPRARKRIIAQYLDMINEFNSLFYLLKKKT